MTHTQQVLKEFDQKYGQLDGQWFIPMVTRQDVKSFLRQALEAQEERHEELLKEITKDRIDDMKRLEKGFAQERKELEARHRKEVLEARIDELERLEKERDYYFETEDENKLNERIENLQQLKQESKDIYKEE